MGKINLDTSASSCAALTSARIPVRLAGPFMLQQTDHLGYIFPPTAFELKINPATKRNTISLRQAQLLIESGSNEKRMIKYWLSCFWTSCPIIVGLVIDYEQCVCFLRNKPVQLVD